MTALLVPGLTSTVEIEAAVACIVSLRLGLRPVSEACLCAFLPNGEVPRTVSMELISKVAGKLLSLTERNLPARKTSGDPTAFAGASNPAASG